MTPGESLDQRLGALTRELAFVRKGIDDLMAEKAALEDRVKALENREVRYWTTPDSEVIRVDGPQIDRWREIERAARETVASWERFHAQPPEIGLLRSALKEEAAS